MKTENLIALFVSLALVACGSSATKNETRSDSTTVQPLSTTTSSTSSFPASVNNFPDYSSELLSEDPLEAEVSYGIDELIAINSSLDFLTVQSHYQREREFEGDYDNVTQTEEVTETWFFDLSLTLRAYSRRYYRDGEGRDTKTLICFFSNDSLIAMSDRWDQDNQVGMIYHKKLLADNCPKCGVDVNKEAGGQGQVGKYFERNDLYNFENEFITSFSEVAGEHWKNAEVIDGQPTTKVSYETSWPSGEVDGKPYTVEYTMSRTLYNYYRFENFITLFDFTDLEIPDKESQFFLNSDGTGSFSVTEKLESKPVYFLLYKKIKQVGPGVEELYAASFTKNGQLVSNFLVGSSFPSSGPDGEGEAYDYNYDSEEHILSVTKTITSWDEKTEQEKSEETVTQYTLDGKGAIVIKK